MVEFLIKRPVAVSMTFIAILVLGIFAMKFIPVSLMPDIDIPEITVQVSVSNTPARELENTVVQSIRRQLMQVAHLADITSETCNENGIIRLKFDYGTDIDFAFIEVNEKIDRAMNYLPRDIQRPRVIKANATDIPVFYLNLTVNSSKFQESSKLTTETTETPETKATPATSALFPVSQKFVELSRFASNVIRKRIEQIPEVAMVDMSGQVSSELLIIPDSKKMESLGITQETLVRLIENSNVKLGNLLIRDGQYQYNIRFTSTLQNKQDIENIWFKNNGRLLQFKDIVKVIEHPQKQKGKVLHNGQDAISIAVIKQSDARMSALKQKLNGLVSRFEKDYPGITFSVTRNQTQLLDYSISNLGQSLVWGALLAFLIMFFFMKDFKAPLLIGIAVPGSLVISMLFFYILGISVNIISLSGIILGVGMMIDNSIIVIDNITQHRERMNSSKFHPAIAGPAQTDSGSKLSPATTATIETPETQSINPSIHQSLDKACVSGTNEVFRPLLSSVLTTCAVFIPMIFISGISGAMFYDQAMAITVGLLVSLAVSVILLPVYYRLVYRRNGTSRQNRFLKKITIFSIEGLYAKGLRLIMKHQGLSWILVGVFLPGAVFLFTDLPKSKLPPITKDEVILLIDWNEQVHIDENRKRSQLVAGQVKDFLESHTSLVGQQQFIMEHGSTASASETMIYFKANSSENLAHVTDEIREFLEHNYPRALFRFKDAGNIFNMIFSDTEKPLVARLKAADDYGPGKISFLQTTLEKLRAAFPEQPVGALPLYEYTVLRTDPEKLLLYGLSFDMVYRKLKSAFNENQLFLIADNQDFVPVVLGDETRTIGEIVRNLFIRNNANELIPLRELVNEIKSQDMKTIVAGKEGEYYPVAFEVNAGQAEGLMATVRQLVNADRLFDVSFTGSIFSNKELLTELSLILLVSLALLYFILASQFESLTLPLIVLVEVPIDIFGAFLALKLGGAGINLMSLIGIIVMSGIIINDSILKIDTMNQLRNQGYSLVRAMVEAGHRRLKPILMTSLTTILALIPFLFTSGLGSDLQRPLALAVIGGMVLGTLVSLYLVPLMYYYLKRRSE
ncbi:efflux RND transporter permease subunit [Gaoshiqia sp. Z1-71]|uniref:efflux RND transporter permease subunit n=1 Tax=Gaoshiqia hydrogeniformans TaxID=3290090 RepID=UPI003BF8FC56